MVADTLADARDYSDTGLKGRQQARIGEALEAEEAAGRLLALRGRTLSLLAIGLFLTLLAPFPDVLFYEALLALFIVAGYGRYGVEKLGLFRWWQPYVQIALDSALLAVTLTIPNPLASEPFPPQMHLRYGNFVYFYVLLMGLAFGYKPKLVLWGGLTVALAWGTATAWIALLPSSILNMPGGARSDQLLAALMQPTFVDLDGPIQDIVVFLIVSALTAMVVARSRRLVWRQTALERERSNLARYFPPATVDRLATLDGSLSRIREQDAAVLFADIVGFTHWSERHEPSEVINLLREVHGRLEETVFRHGGTLDKFIGDGMMATFGTPEPGATDASRALACLTAIVDEFAAWNGRRERRGKSPIRISVGLHYGRVVVGNIGSDRRLELAVLGDTVNVASRLETLTREIGCAAIVSAAATQAALRESGADAAHAGLVPLGPHALKGRDEKVDVLAYG